MPHFIHLVIAITFATSLFSGSKAFSQNARQERMTLEGLDQILDKAGKPEDFLSSSAAQSEYYLALRRYLGLEGGAFPRVVFEDILNLLKGLENTHPEVLNALWRVQATGTAHSVFPGQGDGNDFEPQMNRKAVQDYIGEVRNALADLLSENGLIMDSRFMVWSSSAFSEMRDREAGIDRLKGKDHRFAQDRLMADLKARREVQHFASYVIYQALSSAETKRIFREGNLEQIVQVFDDLRRISTFNGTVLPKYFRWIIASHIPQSQWLKERFGVVKKGSAFKFIPLPRRFHGVWKGIKLKECVGGCSEHRKDIALGRILSVAAYQSEMYFIEQNQRYKGWVHIIPHLIWDTNKVLGNIEFGSPIFGFNYSKSMSGRSGGEISFFELWLEQYLKIKPKAWSGLYVSDGTLVHNFGGLQAVHDSLAYRMAPRRYSSSSLRGLNKRLDFIVDQLDNDESRLQMGITSNGLIYDGSDERIQWLSEVALFDTKVLKSIDSFLAWWKTLERPEQMRYLAELLQLEIKNKQIHELIWQIWTQVSISDRNEVFVRFREDVRFGILNFTPYIEQIFRDAGVNSLKSFFTFHPNQGSRYLYLVVDELRARFSNLGLSDLSIASSLGVISYGYYVESHIKPLCDLLMEKVSSADRLIFLSRQMSQISRSVFADYLEKNPDELFVLRPTIEQIVQLGEILKQGNLALTIAEKAMFKSPMRKAEDFVHLMDIFPEVLFVSKEDLRQHSLSESSLTFKDAFIKKYLETFKLLEPTVWDYLHLADQILAEPRLFFELKDAALKMATTPDQVLAVVGGRMDPRLNNVQNLEKSFIGHNLEKILEIITNQSTFLELVKLIGDPEMVYVYARGFFRSDKLDSKELINVIKNLKAHLTDDLFARLVAESWSKFEATAPRNSEVFHYFDLLRSTESYRRLMPDSKGLEKNRIVVGVNRILGTIVGGAGTRNAGMKKMSQLADVRAVKARQQLQTWRQRYQCQFIFSGLLKVK